MPVEGGGMWFPRARRCSPALLLRCGRSLDAAASVAAGRLLLLLVSGVCAVLVLPVPVCVCTVWVQSTRPKVVRACLPSVCVGL